MKVAILIDVQNDFIDGALPADKDRAVTGRIRKYAYQCKCDRVPILATRDTHYDGPQVYGGASARVEIAENPPLEIYEDTLEGKNLPVKHCIARSDGWELADEVREFVKEANVVNKATFGSLKGLPAAVAKVDEALRAAYGEGVDEIELAGFCTNICVVSNALILRAAFPDTKIAVLENLCAGTTPAEHESALDVMRSCQVEVRRAAV